MATKEFSKEDLKDLVDFCEMENLEMVRDEILDTTRWSIINELIFKDKESGKLYRTNYSVGATECQDESPFEYDPDYIECVEVKEKEVTVIDYVEVE